MSGGKNPVKELGQNIERNVQGVTNSLIAMTKPGGLNNFGQTTLRNYTSIVAPWMNPDQGQDLFGKNNIDRKMDETAAAQRDQQIADAAAEVDAANNQVATAIEGIVQGKKRAPGKSLTLLGSGGAANSLLTYKG